MTVRSLSLVSGFAAAAADFGFLASGLERPLAGPSVPSKTEECAGYVVQIEQVCDLLLLPLGLRGGVSLDIAREIHRQRSPVRTVLFTGSRSATAISTTPLFDYCLSCFSMELPAVLREAIARPVPARKPEATVRRQAQALIEDEHCFRGLPGSRWLERYVLSSL